MGDSGSFCHYCNISKNDANDLAQILACDFRSSKTYEEMLVIWEAVDGGDLRYDDPARHGQCHKPMAKKQARLFTILHQKLGCLDHRLKLLYHLESLGL